LNTKLNTQLGKTFSELVTSGGDDRLDILNTGLNKYYLDPCEAGTVFSRASCTCSSFTPEALDAAIRLYERLTPENFNDVRTEHTARIKNLINYENEDRFHVFYAPSGSDLCYYSLMFSKLIHPDRDIFSVITCPEELGSGSLAAHAGKYFATRNQFGAPQAKGTLLNEDLEIDCAEFSARDSQGRIINHWQSIIDCIHDRYLTHSVNANLVIGSKSGIENNVSIVSQAPEDVLWTIDLCQFRASRVLINGLIGMNCSVMITGSKFYQSPPFCAVLLVPRTITNKFQGDTNGVASYFSQVFSKHDIPSEFPKIRNQLRDFKNYGLLLRWEAALLEMTEQSKLNEHAINALTQQWNAFIVEWLQGSGLFELMPDQEFTNKTIVSFRVRKQNGEFLAIDELRALYENVCLRTVTEIPGISRILIGQPVSYEEKAFVRLALGSHDLRMFERHGLDLQNDRVVLETLAQSVKELFWS
jgi:hypothetical protein